MPRGQSRAQAQRAGRQQHVLHRRVDGRADGMGRRGRRAGLEARHDPHRRLVEMIGEIFHRPVLACEARRVGARRRRAGGVLRAAHLVIGALVIDLDRLLDFGILDHQEAPALGIAAGAYELALEYSKQREQFGRPICEFQGLQWMLVDMHTQLEAARLLLHKAACSGSGSSGQVAPDVPGFPDMQEAAQAKIFASEMAIKVTNDALQIFGSAGYSRNLPLERMARDARMFTIGGGTAQILRTVVASALLERKLPQTRDGHLKLAEKEKK